MTTAKRHLFMLVTLFTAMSFPTFTSFCQGFCEKYLFDSHWKSARSRQRRAMSAKGPISVAVRRYAKRENRLSQKPTQWRQDGWLDQL
jgi:hypothetical protein